MKHIALAGVLAASLLDAGEYGYEITPVLGYTFPNYDQELCDHTVSGVQLQFNDVYRTFKPEISVIYSDTDRKDEQVGDTDIFRLALNGVYELKTIDRSTLFLKAGVGYEIMSDHYYDNHNSFFGDAGVGVKIGLTKQLALKLEMMEMVKYNKSNWDTNLIYMAGFTYAFGTNPPISTLQRF